MLDLNSEYAAISDMYSGGNSPTKPIEAFFGNLLERPIRRKEYPIVLCNKKANLDQLLAISTALKYPLTYVQGPPGTGKTNTIVNTILSAFFNERTVLFASYNNHPIFLTRSPGLCTTEIRSRFPSSVWEITIK